MEQGWIGLYRKFIKWEWYQDHNTKAVFLHLLLMASHEGGNWQGQTIQRGQLITGRKRLAKDLKLTEQQIRTSINKLKSTNEITTKSTTKNSVITITNYELYNPEGQKRTNKPTKDTTEDQPKTNQSVTTLKNEKKEKKKEYTPDSSESRLSKGMFEMMKQNNPKHAEPNWDTWKNDFNMMLRIDNHTYEEIGQVIFWAQRHHFWKNNIQSPAKLRKQFARLFGEMEADKDKTPNYVHSGFLQEPSYQPIQ